VDREMSLRAAEGATPPVVISCASDGVATIEMRDAAGKNAMSAPFVAALLDSFRQVAARDDLKVAVLLGLPEVFSSGASREVLEALVAGAIAPSDLLLSKALLDLPIPTIAAMEGHALGGGLALGLCADIALIARESRYGCPFMNLGFTPGMGITRLLEQVVSPAIAHEMLYAGEPLKGIHFAGRSGFNYILPRAEVRPKALELAARIAEKPRVALATLKRALSLPKRQAFESTRTVEALMHEVTFAQPDVRRLVEEHFA
jgi:polyketide biosynthesis enoyl-CoA hydratase PksI